jgi:hypothetical protein
MVFSPPGTWRWNIVRTVLLRAHRDICGQRPLLRQVARSAFLGIYEVNLEMQLAHEPQKARTRKRLAVKGSGGVIVLVPSRLRLRINGYVREVLLQVFIVTAAVVALHQLATRRFVFGIYRQVGRSFIFPWKRFAAGIIKQNCQVR